MGKLFGTDGIRGPANQYPMTPEMAVKTGKAVAFHFKETVSGNYKPGIILGRDTRISGPMLESALASGIVSMGVDVHLTGILPTPGIARIILKKQALGGVVVSASHNPYIDNGIKLFDGEGFKLPDTIEGKIENLILDERIRDLNREVTKTGRIFNIENPVADYTEFLKATLPEDLLFDGLKLVFDCANGATFQAAKQLFGGLGGETTFLFTDPDGININENCGSEHPSELKKEVLNQRADLGIAFDGDGDRMLAVDHTGTVVTGDQVIAVLARHLKYGNRLTGNRVVTTVMSNLGLAAALTEAGIQHSASEVGDRYVMEKMKSDGAVLGGENSGHIIFLNHHTTGDGLLAALKLLEAIIVSGHPLSELVKVMTMFPQQLINVDVQTKPDINTVPAVGEAIKEAQDVLGEKGRVLVRYSGTQSICRVMVEGPTEEVTNRLCKMIAGAVHQHLG